MARQRATHCPLRRQRRKYPGSSPGAAPKPAPRSSPSLRRSQAVASALPQLADLDVAIADHAAGRLQRDRATRIFHVVDLRRLDSIERRDHVWTLCRDHDRGPFAAGVVLDEWFGDVDDRPRTAALIGALVVDVQFVAILDSRILRLRDAKEEAAVGIRCHPDVAVQLEIAVRLL